MLGDVIRGSETCVGACRHGLDGTPLTVDDRWGAPRVKSGRSGIDDPVRTQVGERRATLHIVFSSPDMGSLSELLEETRAVSACRSWGPCAREVAGEKQCKGHRGKREQENEEKPLHVGETLRRVDEFPGAAGSRWASGVEA